MEVNFISILESIFKISLIASVLASIVLILRPIIKKAFGVNILYLLWLLVIIKLIVPYGPESKASIYNIFNTVKTSNSYEEKVINIHNFSEIRINEILRHYFHFLHQRLHRHLQKKRILHHQKNNLQHVHLLHDSYYYNSLHE